jgi:predicted outer membrane repeat protein
MGRCPELGTMEFRTGWTPKAWTPTSLVAVCGLAGLLTGCGGCEPEAKPYAFEPAPSDCAVPGPVAPLGREVVVGDGSAQSCSQEALRDALGQGGDVSFDCGVGDVTIDVTTELMVPADTILDGAGRITLDGGGVTRLLHTEARVALTVVGLTFVNGNATASAEVRSGGAIRVGWLSTLSVFDCGFFDNVAADDGIEGGGAIYQSNGGALVVVRTTFERNQAISGGAIDNLLAPLTVVDSTFLENTSTAGGGAIYTDGGSAHHDDGVGGVISICGCRFESNESLGTGGAVYLWAYAPDVLRVNRCTFARNAATRATPEDSALGGAMRTGNAPLQIANSLFAENHADVHGGAYWTRGNHRTEILNCTFYRNTAGVVGLEGGYGGALSGFNMQLRNLTFVENHAEFTGGAVSAEGNQWTLDNCIFLDNTSSNQWGLSQTCTDTLPGANNLQWPGPGSDGDPPCSADVLLGDPLLGGLGDHGGPTQTIALTDGSPALDAATDCPLTDQRGEPRPGTGTEPCDMGAFEAQ